MKPISKPIATHLAAAGGGALLATAVLAPFRWRVVVCSGQSSGAFVVDLWTGGARFLAGASSWTVQPRDESRGGSWFEDHADELAGSATLLAVACACAAFVVVPLRLYRAAHGRTGAGLWRVFGWIVAAVLASFGIAAALSWR